MNVGRNVTRVTKFIKKSPEALFFLCSRKVFKNYGVHRIVEVITMGSKIDYVVKTKTWLIKAFIIVGYRKQKNRFMKSPNPTQNRNNDMWKHSILETTKIPG